MYRATLTLFAIVATAFAIQAAGITKQDAPKAEPWTSVQADPIITVLSAAVPSKWIVVDDSGCDLRVHGDGKSASFAASRSGEYRLLVISGEEVQRIKIVVVKIPEPGPGPGPAPVDPLAQRFQVAFDADTRAQTVKANELANLIALYTQAIDFANDPNVATTGDLVGAVQRAAKFMKIEGLAEIRKAIATELANTIGTDDLPLGAENRKVASTAFKKVALALEQVK